MKDQRIDLSSLDPSRDTQRWALLVASVASQALSARRQQLTVSYQLVVWARPALAIAATIALAIWAGALISGSRSASSASDSQEGVYALARWASNNEIPAPSEVLQLLGDHHDTK